jgi:hypothetical protein
MHELGDKDRGHGRADSRAVVWQTATAKMAEERGLARIM